MVTVGGRHPQLLALGGMKRKNWQDTKLDSVEEWDENTEQWKTSPITLRAPMDSMGALAVPPIAICADMQN